MKGRRINSLRGLMMAVNQQKCVMYRHGIWDKIVPAAFVVNYPGIRILHYFINGMWIYKPNKKGE